MMYNKDKLPYMYELSYRANIDVYSVEIDGVQKYVILYEDHRTILNVLYFARMKGVLSKAPNIIYFDHHDDACEILGDQLDKIRVLPISRENFQTFWHFVEFDLGEMDDDWVWVGMYVDLIKNAVRIGGEQDDNVSRLNEFFTAQNKHLYLIDHLDLELDNRGCFVDTLLCNTETDKHIRSIFNVNWSSEINTEQDVSYVLDFDLDCFTGRVDDKTIAWPEMIFCKHYERNVKTKNFLRNLIKHSAFITICKESKCCGGIGEANKILSYLDCYLFNGQLNATSIL